MSTPMRHGPSQQGRTPSQHPAAAPTPQASSPFPGSQPQAAFSPRGARSSPQQFKKSPAAKNSPANATSTAMMGSAATAPVNFDSPSAAAALGALGINDLSLDHLGMGGLVGGSGRGSEEEFRKKLDDVIDILWSAKSALVSNEGLERVTNHLGLECMWEDTIGGGEGAKTLIIAGSTFSVEVSVNKHIVQEAALAFGDSIPIVDKHVAKASAILKGDLTLDPEQSPLTKRLRAFWTNLEHLRDLDKLSISPGLNCHEAVAGLYESLDKLHQWDVSKLREMPELSSKSPEQLKIWALCTRHGSPQMHARGRVGLSFDYWMDKFKWPGANTGSVTAKTWGILVSCAHASNMVYSSVRVSDKWIGPDVEKTNPSDEEVISTDGPIIDWLEPEPTLLPEAAKAEGAPESNSILSGPKSPEVVFMATFDPPVTVSNHAALEIYKYSATQPPVSSTFDAWLFPIPRGTTYDPSEPRVIEHIRTVPTWTRRLEGQPQDEPEVKSHKNSLHVYKPVYGQVIKQVPFSHPKELVQMLPVLRQYAFLSTLLYSSFKSPLHDSKAQSSAPGSAETSTAIDNFDRFMSQSDDGPEKGTNGRSALPVDVTLTAHPVPRLQVVFPFRSKTANIMLEIQPGGRVHIVSHNVFPGSESVNDHGDKGKATGRGMLRDISVSQWARKLEYTEDIGAWVELIKFSLE